VGGDGRKALIQITERCNLNCAHCFVSSGDWGDHMRFDDIVGRVLLRLNRARVERLTLAGGEEITDDLDSAGGAVVADSPRKHDDELTCASTRPLRRRTSAQGRGLERDIRGTSR
jgi:molybdenum cofactor biosynthesis enzyme MoaA